MFEIDNLTTFSFLAFGTALSPERNARVVVAKAHYALEAVEDATGDGPTLTLRHDPDEGTIFVADEPYGALNASSVRLESDLAPFKPKCDVIVIGSAHSPTGRPVPRVDVGIAIEAKGKTLLSHRLAVHGPRAFLRHDALDRSAAAVLWLASLGSVAAPEWRLTDAEPFVELPLRYEEAFGGELKVYAHEPAADRLDKSKRLPDDVRRKHPEGANAPIAHTTCRFNPVGRGFVEPWHVKASQTVSYPAPRIESPAALLTAALFDAMVRGKVDVGSQPALTPQGFGVIAKSWQPRLKLAGTYDEVWRTEHWPYSPPDFDMAFWNGAHPSMQCAPLRGGETITLTNLLPSGSPGTAQSTPDATVARLRLPAVELALRLTYRTGPIDYLVLAIDTLTLDLDAMTVSLVWRVRLPDSLGIDDAQLLSLTAIRAGSRTPTGAMA